jgi:hypothetical protein
MDISSYQINVSSPQMDVSTCQMSVLLNQMDEWSSSSSNHVEITLPRKSQDLRTIKYDRSNRMPFFSSCLTDGKQSNWLLSGSASASYNFRAIKIKLFPMIFFYGISDTISRVFLLQFVAQQVLGIEFIISPVRTPNPIPIASLILHSLLYICIYVRMYVCL